MTGKAIDFLLSEQKAGGIWSYYTSRDMKVLNPDIDDTAKVSFILKINNRDFEDNLDLISNNRNEEGLYFTWINVDDKVNDIDCVVNTNVLLYLGRNIPEVCSFVNNAVILEKTCSLYYPNELVLFYSVSTAYKNNITCFEESKEKIIDSVLSLQKHDGSFGSDLNTTLALNTLLNFDYEGEEAESAASYLLKTQRVDGSWRKDVIYVGLNAVSFEMVGGKLVFSLIPAPEKIEIMNFFVSEELTTALAIEALHKYLQITEETG